MAPYAFFFWVWGLILSKEPPRTSLAFRPLAYAIAENARATPLPAPWDSPEDTAALLVSVAWFESRFTRDAREPVGDSCGYFQTPCPAPKTEDGQTKAALRLLRWSLTKCGNLTAYVSGYCGKAPLTAKKREDLARALRATPAIVP